LGGDLIIVSGIGRFRSPLVKELKPSGIGIWTYHFYLNLLSWSKDEFLRFIRLSSPSQSEILGKNPHLNIFDMITILPASREMLCEALAFFMTDKIVWDDVQHKFVMSDGEGKPSGEISCDNFDEVRDMVLKLNYINLDEKTAVKPQSQKTKEGDNGVQSFG